MLMREHAAEVVEGLAIMRHILGAEQALIGIEDNKPQAIAALREAVAAQGQDMEVVGVPTRYPAGGEKQLIYTLTGKEVPSDGLPAQIGVVCHNVGTAYAVQRAVVHGEPLLSRMVTLAGDAIPQPRNLEVLLGTPVAFLLGHVEARLDAVERLVMGGPMMGFTLPSDAVPVVKTSNCLLAQTRAEAPPPRPARPCIRCGACNEVCPAGLLPQQLYWHARAKDFDKVQDHALFDCIECGCCAAVCPSDIPLVGYYRFAKSEVYAQERERRKADIARRRHEARQERQEREKRERAERMQKKKAALAAKQGREQEDPKKAAIQAALARAKAKKAASGVQPRNTEDLTPAQRRLMEEADARRARNRQRTPGAPAQESGGQSDASPADKGGGT
jgi:electron transport complex protein RnfC